MQVIVHWHGPKPERCLRCYSGLENELKINREYITECGCPEPYNTLWFMAVDADGAGLYKKLIRDHDKYASMIPDDHVYLGSY